MAKGERGETRKQVSPCDGRRDGEGQQKGGTGRRLRRAEQHRSHIGKRAHVRAPPLSANEPKRKFNEGDLR